MLEIFKKSKRGGDLKCIVCGNINYYTIGMVQKMESVVCKKCLPPPIKIVTPKLKTKTKKRKKYKKRKKLKKDKIKVTQSIIIKPIVVRKTKRPRFENEQEYRRYLRLRQKLLFKTNYSCQECGDQSDILQIHHIDNNNKNNLQDNLLVLCRPCHAKKHPKLANLIMSSNRGKVRR